MKERKISCAAAVIVATILCIVAVIPAVADGTLISDAKAPLKNIIIAEGKTDDYKISPTFQQNTHVYTVTGENPADKEAAKAIISCVVPTTDPVTTYDQTYDKKTQLMTITTTKGLDSSVYYVSFSGISAVATDIAHINVKKILDAEMEVDDGTDTGTMIPNDKLKLDSLTFSYELLPAKIVSNTAPVGVNTIPLSEVVNDDDDTDGLVTVATDNEPKKSTMIFDRWDNVDTTVSNIEAAAAGDTDLEGKKYVDGTFSIKYTKVGQYVYILHELPGNATGVTYDDSYYEVTVSVVNKDPGDLTKGVVVGWIEVREITSYTSPTVYTSGNKINFGSNEKIDGEKYDHSTTSITYPFINILATEDLVVNKTVTGDLGDKDQEFLFKLDIEGTNLAELYDISYAEAANHGTAYRPQKIKIASASGKGTAYISLKHTETFTVSQLPVGVKYVLTELNPVISADRTYIFYNDKNVPPPTGISVDIRWAWILVIFVLTAFSVMFVTAYRRKRDFCK